MPFANGIYFGHTGIDLSLTAGVYVGYLDIFFYSSVRLSLASAGLSSAAETILESISDSAFYTLFSFSKRRLSNDMQISFWLGPIHCNEYSSHYFPSCPCLKCSVEVK